MRYATDRAYSDTFIPQIKRIVGPYLLTTTTLEQDRREAGDLTILRGCDRLMIAARVRRPSYALFARQFTLRTSGTYSELQKVLDGFGDWFLYAHADAGDRIATWMLIDLAAFRSAQHDTRVVCGDQRNGDGSAFRWYDVDSFPAQPALRIASRLPPRRRPIIHDAELVRR